MLQELLLVIRNAEVTASVPEVMVMVVALSLCLLFRFNRMGLIIAYLYVMYSGWRFCQIELMPKAVEFQMYAFAYLALGVVVLFLTVVGMIRSTDGQ